MFIIDSTFKSIISFICLWIFVKLLILHINYPKQQNFAHTFCSVLIYAKYDISPLFLIAFVFINLIDFIDLSFLNHITMRYFRNVSSWQLNNNNWIVTLEYASAKIILLFQDIFYIKYVLPHLSWWSIH